MDMLYCMLMAICLILAANSKVSDSWTRAFLQVLSVTMALLAVANLFI